MAKEDLKMRQYMVGFDIGTSSVKAVAFDFQGKVLGKTSASYPTLSPQPGWQEQHPVAVFKASLRCLKNVLPIAAGQLAGVSLSSAMHSVIAFDKMGQPLTNCLLWSDNRSAAIAEQLKGTVTGRKIYQHTGTPIHAMTPLNKIAWLRQNEPALFQKTSMFAGIKEYLVYRLTGEWLTDYSVASATGLLDATKSVWHMPALEFAGIKSGQLPLPVPSTHKLGNIKHELAHYLGIPPTTPFIIGASDGCLANLGAGASLPGEAVLTIGTSGALRMNTDRPAFDDKERIFNYLLTENQFITGGASNNGAVVYEWFTRQFFGTGPAAKRIKRKQEALSKIPAGSEGLLFVPYLLGERAPVWNARAEGGFWGLTTRHSLGHFHKAVLEGILLNMGLIGEVLEEVVGPMDVIYANGGFAKMPVWVQLAADVFGTKICLSESEEASALGAALLGMKALGVLADFSRAKEMAGIKNVYLPNPANHEIYQRKKQALKEVYSRLYH